MFQVTKSVAHPVHHLVKGRQPLTSFSDAGLAWNTAVITFPLKAAKISSTHRVPMIVCTVAIA